MGVISLIVFWVSMVSVTGFAQDAKLIKANKVEQAVAQAQEGTYQLIFTSRNDEVNIKLSPEELAIVEKLRHATEVVYARADYSDDIRVKILPRAQINSNGFKPVPPRLYKDEMQYEEKESIRYIDFR